MLSDTHPVDLKQLLSDLVSELESVENEINTALSDSMAVAKSIYKHEEQLQETRLLANRYQKLLSQYKSDSERLTLIVDGERLINEHNEHLSSHNCPFCNGELDESMQTSYIDACRFELQTLISQLADLSEAITETESEKEVLSSTIELLKSQRVDISNNINSQLKPKSTSLQEKITNIESFIEINQQLKSMQVMQAKLKADLEAIENEDDDKTPKYKPKDRFESDFYPEMSTLLDEMLSQMSYKLTQFRSAFFAKNNFDIKINGNPKIQGNGQGYTSFLNSVVVMAYRHVLYKNAKYMPSVFLIDTPLLGLDERNKEEAQDSMKENLFQYFIDHQNEGQLIIIENTINLPNLDYASSGVKEIKFTENKYEGRYGFLYDVYN
ncbi:hypothetical protein [Listeria monocytogenes]|uniref:hypothetical protein n=1 Tax=Listeria monocytogenes TaxID=1639 RepID=UPI000A9BA6AB|nr:hypothetical protein [Listeria monocytogenes]